MPEFPLRTKACELAAAAAIGGIASGLAVFATLRRRRQRVRRIANSFNPQWRPGSKQWGPYLSSDVLTLSPDELKSKYSFFISCYVPRPIALVSSVSASGCVNLAPFSYSAIVNHDPGTILFACETPAPLPPDGVSRRGQGKGRWRHAQELQRHQTIRRSRYVRVVS